MKHNRLILALGLIGLAVLVLMLKFTSPAEIGPFGVLLFFTTIYAVIFSIVTFTMEAFYRLALKRKTFRNKDYLYAAIASFGPIMFLAAGSFGAINFWVIGLIIIFVFLAEFLVYKKN